MVIMKQHDLAKGTEMTYAYKGLSLQNFICSQLRQETQKATGCTEIAATALVVAKAVETLGEQPQEIHLTVSPNIYKNGAFAGVPGMDKPGFSSAIAIGAALSDTTQGLNLLDAPTHEVVGLANNFLQTVKIKTIFDQTPHAIFLHTEVVGANHSASATICGHHSHFERVARDGETLFEDQINHQENTDTFSIKDIPVHKLIEIVPSIPVSELEFLLDAAEINANVCTVHKQAPERKLADALQASSQLYPSSSRRAAQALAGSASEARMTGCTAPVMSITGSGNHGLAGFLGVLGAAQTLKASREQTIYALAIASIVTIAIKAHTGKLTAFCGCSIAPATGIAAAIVFLHGGNIQIMEEAMQSVIGTFAGMLCDGAKLSCAFKVSTVVGAAVDMAEMALKGAHVPKGDGILGQDMDASFANLAKLNQYGMQQTETVVLGMI